MQGEEGGKKQKDENPKGSDPHMPAFRAEQRGQTPAALHRTHHSTRQRYLATGSISRFTTSPRSFRPRVVTARVWATRCTWNWADSRFGRSTVRLTPSTAMGPLGTRKGSSSA